MIDAVFVLGAGLAGSSFLFGLGWRRGVIARRKLHLLSLGMVALAAVAWPLLVPIWLSVPALVPVLVCTLPHLLVRGRSWGKPVLLLLFAVNLVVLFNAFWWLASPGTTWGNDAQLPGLVASTTLLLSLQTLALAHGSPRPFGFGKVGLGAAMLFSVAGFGFRHNEWVTALEVKIRWGILVTCLALIAEGLLFITMDPAPTE